MTDNDILVIRFNTLMSYNDWEIIRQDILKQLKTGVVVLPSCCEAIFVPNDVVIKVETAWKEEEKRNG